MKGLIKKFSSTLQGIESPVPVPVRGEKAGPEASLTDDCNTPRIGHVALGVFNTTLKGLST